MTKGMGMSDAELLYDVREKTAWFTINREQRRNALSLGMIDLFFQYLDRAEADDAVRVGCITAVGDKAFCSGADLTSATADGDPLAGAAKYAELLKRMAHFSKPLVARINGHCMAGGMGFMLSCDLVYAREGVNFGTPEVNVGLFPMMIGALIFRNAGRKKALEMIYTARTYSAAEAEEMGLITRACPAETLDATVSEALRAIASKAPLALRFGRRAFAAVEGKGLEESLDYLCEELRKVASTEDAKEGMTAFVQKREPVWKGR
ncbi:MAG: enoyl-CoA hydratase-related protein [Desulfomonilaceae bacterium]|nr:enoyl-CoA hydratase-related protein [Desulfomonilaceae bacterium]